MVASSSNAGDAVLVIVLVIISFCLYWLPTFVAWRRGHHQFWAIARCQFLLGLDVHRLGRSSRVVALGHERWRCPS